MSDSLPTRLRRALEKQEYAGSPNDYTEGRDFEHARLAPLHERLVAVVEALQLNAGNIHYPAKALEALAALEGALGEEEKMDVSIEQWRENLLKAIEAQALDDTLWTEGSVGEAYAYQSLRWLHRVIEENDLDALRWIINQSKGDI